MKSNIQQKRQYGLKISPKFIIVMCAVFFGFLMIVGILTQILPQGEYQRTLIDGQESIINGTYHLLANQEKLPVWKWFTAPVEVLFTKSDMILFLMIPLAIICGIYYVLDKSDLLKRFVSFTYKKLSNHKYLMLVLIVTLFLLFGSIGGLTEEVIGFIPLMILMSISFRWDSLVGISLCYLAAVRGYSAATFNPYGTALVQSIAGVPIYSGLWLRFVYLFLSGAILVLYVYFYAKHIERNPLKSVTYDTDANWRNQYTGQTLLDYKKRKYSFKTMIIDFFKGALNILPTIAIFCFILGIQYLIEEGNILDTIIYNVSNLMQNASPFGAAMIMFLFVLVVEIVIPGTMPKALVILPIVTPLGELSGISKQATCFIFSIGDSFPNLLYPTDPTLILVLAMLGTSYKKWLKWLWPYILITAAVSIAMIALALFVGY